MILEEVWICVEGSIWLVLLEAHDPNSNNESHEDSKELVEGRQHS